MTPGTVYFVQELPNGAIKIGWTSGNVADRWHNIQTGNPRDVVVIGIIEESTFYDEQKWHHRFHGCRCGTSGEWFWPTAELMAAIRAEASSAAHLKRTRRNKRPPTPWALALQTWMIEEGYQSRSLEEAVGRRSIPPGVFTGRNPPSAPLAHKIEILSKGAVKASLLLSVVQEEAA